MMKTMDNSQTIRDFLDENFVKPVKLKALFIAECNGRRSANLDDERKAVKDHLEFTRGRIEKLARELAGRSCPTGCRSDGVETLIPLYSREFEMFVMALLY
jgi:hypothetical protein